METSVFSGLNLTSKDSKILVPALVSFLQNFERKIEQMFTEIKEDFQLKLIECNSKVRSLENEISVLNGRMRQMEKLADDADAYQRRDILIFSGSAIPEVTNMENCTTLLQNLLRTKLNFNLSTNEINTVHRLGPKPKSQDPDKRSIILKLCRRDLKRDIIYASKNQDRGSTTKLFANESLTLPRQKIFKTLRNIKRDHPQLIKGVTSFEGRIYVYTASEAAVTGISKDKRHLVNDHDSLVKFCEEYVKKPVETFLQTFQS